MPPGCQNDGISTPNGAANADVAAVPNNAAASRARRKPLCDRLSFMRVRLRPRPKL
jgi:hypothetical protein